MTSTDGRSVRLLALVRPCLYLLPEVRPPETRVPIREKIFWTAICLFIFLVCCQIPLYGVEVAKSSDPFYWMRVMLASNRGTLMELGLSPILTASWAMQLLLGARWIDVDLTLAEDQRLFFGAQKVLALVITAGEAVAYVLSGMYGDPSALGLQACAIIVAQLFVAGLLAMLLDELLQKGYGLGSGIAMFIAANICETIFWKALSPVTIITSQGIEFEGAFVEAFHLLLTRSSGWEAVMESSTRQTATNLLNLAATASTFLVVIYLQSFQVNLPCKFHKARGQPGFYQIRLFYTSNISIIMQTAIVSNLYFLSNLLYQRFTSNLFVNLIGQWSDPSAGPEAVPIGGLAYYISPPGDFGNIQNDPFRAFCYVTFVLITCAQCSKLWVGKFGSSAREVALQLRERHVMLKGDEFRDRSILSVLLSYIPVATTFGAVLIGALTIVADFCGVVGSGTGILLVITILRQHYEQLEQAEKAKDQGGSLF